MKTAVYPIALASCLLMVSCWTLDPPGKGPKAEYCIQKSRAVISAIENYEKDKGEYPESLEDLAPDYLDLESITLSEKERKEYLIHDSRHPGRFFGYENTYGREPTVLTVEYAGPGMNRGAYSFETTSWRWTGYY